MTDDVNGGRNDGARRTDDAPTAPFDPLDDEHLLTTDEIDAIAEERSEEKPGRLERVWHRIDHVWHTRVRTTTAILVAAFFVCVVGYGYATDYYGVAPQTVNEQQQQRRVTPEPTTSEVPESTVSGRPSVSETPEETESESESRQSPSSTSTTTGPFDFLNPNNRTESPSPSPDSDSAPTQSVPAR